MKLKINKDVLVRAMQLITPITARSSNNPMLSNFLLDASKQGETGEVRFSATDYDLSIQVHFPGQVEREGSVCISAKRVLDVCREFSGAEVSVEQDDQMWVAFAAGKSRLRLPSVEPGLYPELDLPGLSSAQDAQDLPLRFSMRAEEFCRCLGMSLVSVPIQETRKNLMGVCLRLLENGKARWVSTDGHRLSQVSREVEPGSVVDQEAPEIIIPRKSLEEINKVLERKEDQVKVAWDERVFRLWSGNIMISTRLVEGKFPDVSTVIPKDAEHTARLDKSRLVNSLKMISQMSDERVRPVKISFTQGNLRLESEHSDYGEVMDEMPAQFEENEPFTIGFNTRYLLEALSVKAHGKGEKVELRMKKALDPCLLALPGDDGYLAVIMPLRLEW